MKRMLSIFMVLLLIAAPAIAQNAAIEGDWELISMVIDGYTYENLKQQGLVMTMHLEADGTGIQTINDEVYNCTWKVEGEKIIIDDDSGTISYILQPDGTLLGEDKVGDTMTFARAGTEPASVAGTWKMTSAESEGTITTDVSTLGIEYNLILNADGTGMVSSGDAEASCTWTQNGTAVTVLEENSDNPIYFTLQPDGTLSWVIGNVTATLSRTDDTASTYETPAPSGNATSVSEYGFSVQLPEGWFAVDSEYVAQLAESIGEEIASANGFDQNLLDQLAASNASLYYNQDISASFNVVREPAGNITMDNFISLESSYREILRNSRGITDFKLSGPVDINGKPYYVGTFTTQEGLDQEQYFCVANSYIYTITLTNVSDEDAEQLMESFEIL